MLNGGIIGLEHFGKILWVCGDDLLFIGFGGNEPFLDYFPFGDHSSTMQIYNFVNV